MKIINYKMFFFNKNTVKLKKLIFLIVILSSFVFSSNLIFGNPSKAIIGPLSILGEISNSEKKILFNRFREQINRKYHIVSHKILDLISEQGIFSFNIEDCNNSKCVRIILNFLNNLRKKYNAEDLFILQIVKGESETQLSLNLASLSTPEVTKSIVNESCSKCNIGKLKNSIDFLVNKMFSKLGIKELDKENITEVDLSDKILTPKKNDFIKESLQDTELSRKEKNQLPQSEKNPQIDKEEIVTDLEPDPYLVERDLYNQHIGRLLTDVTYALQIFRSGMFVQIEVSIDPSGTVVNQKIVNSSGSHDFDETALMSLEEIQFKPLTENMIKYGNYVVNLQIHNSR